MPSLIKHIPPDFNINTVKGWNTRLLYNFYGSHANATMDYVSVTGADYTINIFDAIDTWASGIGRIVSKGQFLFPHRYFKTGKSIRVRGRVLVTSDDSRTFNIRASINNSNYGTSPVAAQNDGANHTFAKGNIRTNVPVEFEIVYTSVETTESYLYMQANGYYKYEYDFYSNGGRNLSVVHVPIWFHGQYVRVDSDLTGNYTNKIYISFDGSDVQAIKLFYLTVEELS